MNVCGPQGRPLPKKDPFGGLTPQQRADLGDRIRVLVEAAGTQAQAASIAQVSIQQLGRFMRTDNAPSLMPLARLAEATGISLDWVALGVGERYRVKGVDPAPQNAPAVSPELFRRVLEEVAKAHQNASIHISPTQLVEIGMREYEPIASLASRRSEERLLLKAMAARLESEAQKGRSPTGDRSRDERESEVRRKGESAG